MKTTLLISALMALCCSAGMAATVAIDLNGETSNGEPISAVTKQKSFGNINSANTITAENVVSWLENTSGWKGTPANGSYDTIFGNVTANGDNDVNVTFINRNARGGSVIGTTVTLTGDYANYTGLTLSVDCTGLQSGANFTVIDIVYQTEQGWQISHLTGQASALKNTGTNTLNVDLTETPLTSDTAYIVMSTRNGGGTYNSNLTFSMSATVKDVVPEPATASLSLLGLSLLMLRRKR